MEVAVGTNPVVPPMRERLLMFAPGVLKVIERFGTPAFLNCNARLCGDHGAASPRVAIPEMAEQSQRMLPTRQLLIYWGTAKQRLPPNGGSDERN